MSSHEIILCGDMNSSLQIRRENEQDQKLCNFIQEMHLTSPKDAAPTFFHENGKDTSTIDYILTKFHQLSVTRNTTVREKDPLNLSDHTALELEIDFDFNTRSPKKISISVNPKLQSCDVHRGIRNSLQSIKESTSMYDIQCQTRDLTNILKDATLQSIPNYKTSDCEETVKDPP